MKADAPCYEEQLLPWWKKCWSGLSELICTIHSWVSTLSLKSTDLEITQKWKVRLAVSGFSGAGVRVVEGVWIQPPWEEFGIWIKIRSPGTVLKIINNQVGLTAQNSQDVTCYPKRGAFCSGCNRFSWCGRKFLQGCPDAGDHSSGALGSLTVLVIRFPKWRVDKGAGKG